MIRAFHSYHDLTPTDRTAVMELIRSLGADPDHIAVDFAVVVVDGHCHLHLTELLCDDLGRHYLVDGEIASRPLVFDVDPERLPVEIRPTSTEENDHA